MREHRLAVLLCMVLALSCHRRTGDSRSDGPRRPSAVPVDAVWLGGSKGGVFVACNQARQVDQSEIYHCEFFNDWSGASVGSGDFRLDGMTPQQLGASGRDAYVAWSGDESRDEIVLRDGGALRLVEPPRPSDVPAAARWGGGTRCGAFVDCKPAPKAGEATCEVYDQHTGAVVLSGVFAETNGRSFDVEEVNGRCPEWSGIELKGGRRLWKKDAMSRGP